MKNFIRVLPLLLLGYCILAQDTAKNIADKNPANWFKSNVFLFEIPELAFNNWSQSMNDIIMNINKSVSTYGGNKDLYSYLARLSNIRNDLIKFINDIRTKRYMVLESITSDYKIRDKNYNFKKDMEDPLFNIKNKLDNLRDDIKNKFTAILSQTRESKRLLLISVDELLKFLSKVSFDYQSLIDKLRLIKSNLSQENFQGLGQRNNLFKDIKVQNLLLDLISSKSSAQINRELKVIIGQTLADPKASQFAGR